MKRTEFISLIFGVVLGLTYGIASFLIYTYQALTQNDYPHSPETP